MVLGDPNDKYTPDLRWPVFTRKSLAGFTRKLTVVLGKPRVVLGALKRVQRAETVQGLWSGFGILA